METISHLAGPMIAINGRAVQRCVVCGEKLVDSKGMAAPLREDGTAESIGHWEMGRFVRVTAGNPTHYELLPEMGEDGKVPEDNCMATGYVDMQDVVNAGKGV